MFFNTTYIYLKEAKAKFNNEIMPIFNYMIKNEQVKNEFFNIFKNKKKNYYIFPCFFE